MRYLITPHDGVEQWVKKNNNISYDQRLDTVEAIDIAPGDHIIGQLDIQQVKKMLNRKRANYEHLLVDWPKKHRH
ncbi:CRISPR-associated protein Csx16 [Vibrio sinaloensis]|nr:CRISPR-associated protein Csx16 [Vibrio sinaloensis]